MGNKKDCQFIQVCTDDEIQHILKKLKQRFDAQKRGRDLVYRVEREIKRRYVPKRNKTVNELARGEAYAKIAKDTSAEFYKIASEIHKILGFDTYSDFQFYGWGFVYDSLSNKTGLIISAPTGSGKTETFIPPLILKVIDEVKKGNDFMALIVYPRTALLKEQAERIFKYVYKATQELKPKKDIVIGLQFAGVASSINHTLKNNDIFENEKKFLLFKCSICKKDHLIFEKDGGKHKLECSSCGAKWRVSLAKETHVSRKIKPNILITTFESLDRLFLHPKFEELFKRIEAIFIDEVHLFHGIYGAHISNFIKNIEETKESEIAKIGISATIANPKEFGSKLFYKKQEEANLHVLSAEEFEKEKSGCEYIYFIKALQEENSSLEAATFIQTAMAIGHGVLKSGEQALAFIDSIDLVKRFKSQIQDAEENKNLWRFRTVVDEIKFENLICPKTDPCECEIYKNGECWRVVNLGKNCYKELAFPLKEKPLTVKEVSSKSLSADGEVWEKADLILSTPSLEVGIDRDTILATLHYRAPRSVFSFIQRRGRAGRRSDKAYTFVILGNTSMDNFYFYKCHRLLDETRYSLPLNPKNEVVEKIHAHLIIQRNELVEKYKKSGERALQVIKDFIINFFENCSLLNDIYADKIKELKELPPTENKNFIDQFGNWIKEEKSKLETYFNVEQIIKFMKEEVHEIREYADELLDTIRKDNFEKVKELENEISIILSRKELELKERLGRNHEEVREFMETKDKLESMLDQLGTLNLDTRVVNNIENYYLFFKTLVDRLEAGQRDGGWLWKSRSIPDIVKTFFQASFYLHLNIIPEEDRACLFSEVDFYLPDAYFQEVKPIVVEVQRGKYRAEPVLEDSSMLEYMLIPYKAIYRYSGDEFINLVDTGRNDMESIEKDDERTYKVTIPIKHEYIKGLDKGNSFEVSSISVKSLRTDPEGKQTLKICPECFTLYSYNKIDKCHNLPLIPVRVDAKPVSRKDVKIKTLEETTQFTLDSIKAKILIEGSDVKVFRTIIRNGDINPTKNQIYQLEVRYEKPLSYSLISKGIRWKVDKSLLESLSPEKREILLHTGAHLLLKVVASLGGVHEQVLQYHFDPEKGEIYVWERYEGGIGVVDTVFSKIKENPIEVYEEFISSVLCPIHLADEILDKKIENVDEFLKSLVIKEFHIGEDTEVLSELIKEVKTELEKTQERKELEKIQEQMGDSLCEDGCPICIHINYCQAGFNQEEKVSREFAEKLVKSLVKEEVIENLSKEDENRILVRMDSKVLLVKM